MRRLDLKFDIGETVGFRIENKEYGGWSLSGTKVIKGEIIDIVKRFDEKDYIVRTPRETWQIPCALISYFNSAKLENEEKYLSVKKRLPEIGEEVIVSDYSRKKDIMQLVLNSTGTIGDRRTVDLSWYQGGLPLCNSTSWRPVPAEPE
jgi:hypothetical protein